MMRINHKIPPLVRRSSHVCLIVITLAGGCRDTEAPKNRAWVAKLDGPTRSQIDNVGDFGRFVLNLADEVARDRSHVRVLREILPTSTEEQTRWAAKVLVELASINPSPQYLELADLLDSREDVDVDWVLCDLYSNYPVTVVGDRLTHILTDAEDMGARLVAVRVLDGLCVRDGYEGILGMLDSATTRVLSEADDAFLSLEVLILRRRCDLISNDDCFSRLNELVAREGPDFRPEWVSELREMCADGSRSKN